jgi:uncharacterized membrane protein YphA (DoxX/SURF4 family)
MEDIIQKTGIVFLLGMYLYSGVNKAFTFEGTRNAIKSKFPIKLPDFIYTLALIGVILLLTVGSSIVGYSVFTNKLVKISSYITIALILFTIMATLMFHFPSEKEKYHFMKNMSIIGGFLILLSSFINRQSKIVN